MNPKIPSNNLRITSSVREKRDIESGQVQFPLSKGKNGLASTRAMSIWVIINVLTTVAIVYVNKSIFSTSSFSNCYVSFVAYHFMITGLILYIAGRPSVAIFKPAEIPLPSILPLAIITCANVISMNIALAYSSILFYQIIRILLTPVTAMMNFLFYGSRLPKYAAMALLPACVGVGLVSYADTLGHSSERPNQPLSMKSTSSLGIIFSLVGLMCSSVYTVWVAHYHSRLHLSSIQLLYNQVPFCAVLLCLLSAFTDNFPVWKDVSHYQWCLLLISGSCACMIHLSTFYIINMAGPVTSTVVAQMKTCLIVCLGWAMNPGRVGGYSVLGIISALSGIMFYSLAMYSHRTR